MQAPQLALLHAISNPSKPLRHVVGTNIAVVVVAGGLADWPELLVQMVQCLESSDANALEGALDALYKARAPYGSPTPVVARCKVAQLCGEQSDGVFVDRKAIVSLQIMQSVAASACLTGWVLRPLRLDVHTLLHMTLDT